MLGIHITEAGRLTNNRGEFHTAVRGATSSPGYVDKKKNR